MDQFNTITINGTEYYKADDILIFDKGFFYGCRNNVRNIVAKKKIDQCDHIYAYNKDGIWTIPKEGANYRPARLLLTKEWCADNVPKFAKNSKIESKYEGLPPIIELDEIQKFKVEDNIYDIEMVGELNKNNCYFKTDDISRIFNMPSLKRTLISSDTLYKINIHYKYFIAPIHQNLEYRKIKNMQNKAISYMTYKGVIMCIFHNTNPLAESFQDWCLDKLFKHQFGTIEQKQELAADLLDTTSDVVKEVFNKSATTIPCVYLFTIGTAGELRKSMNIDKKYKDHVTICKYGMTIDIAKRSKQHETTYGKIEGAKVCLKLWTYIDAQNISKAESTIKHYFEGMNCNVEYKNHVELVAIDFTKNGKLIDEQYKNLATLYSGRLVELMTEIERLKNIIILKDKDHKIALMDLEQKNEILQRDHQIELNKILKRLDDEKHNYTLLEEKHKYEIQKYEMESLKRKIELLEQNNRKQ